eukprot:TRINITY_DN3068_c0_g1_i4.p4 TRINITY_DN3068_c0_g1~~TRINITY_DN3068_c0_g1_i4.p4  ORF type:complete len:104 (+),score=12.38 TRINITY_DN3068_c0_g1_i4:393-704(+)
MVSKAGFCRPVRLAGARVVADGGGCGLSLQAVGVWGGRARRAMASTASLHPARGPPRRAPLTAPRALTIVVGVADAEWFQADGMPLVSVPPGGGGAAEVGRRR